MYHRGRGTVCPVFVFMQARHFLHAVKMMFFSCVLLVSCMRKCFRNSCNVALDDRWCMSPWWHTAMIWSVIWSLGGTTMRLPASTCSGMGPLLSVYSVCMLCRFCAAAMFSLRGHCLPSTVGMRSAPCRSMSLLDMVAVSFMSNGFITAN